MIIHIIYLLIIAIVFIAAISYKAVCRINKMTISLQNQTIETLSDAIGDWRETVYILGKRIKDQQETIESMKERIDMYHKMEIYIDKERKFLGCSGSTMN